MLLLSQPADIILAGVTGTVGYKPAGSSTWTQITNVCGGTYAAPSDPTFPGECYISDGTNTKIVTYHFTVFGSLNANPAPSGVGGGAGVGGAGAGGSGGPTGPVMTQISDSCYEITNFTVPNSETVYLKGVPIIATMSSVMSDSSALIINGATYILTLGNSVNILSASGYNFTAVLKSISYLPILQSATVDFCAIPQAPALVTISSTTTVPPTNTVTNSSATTNSTTPLQQSASPSNSSGILLYVAGVALVGAVAVLVYSLRVRGRKGRK